MERLTCEYDGLFALSELCTFDKNKECIDCVSCSACCEEEIIRDCATCPIQKAIDKLAEYEQAEEDGLLIRLPCKVGRTVYLTNHVICRTRGIPLRCVVDEFTVDHRNKCYAVLDADMVFCAMRRFKAVDIEEFGHTIFTTKAEAEQALAKMKGE